MLERCFPLMGRMSRRLAGTSDLESVALKLAQGEAYLESSLSFLFLETLPFPLGTRWGSKSPSLNTLPSLPYAPPVHPLFFQ